MEEITAKDKLLLNLRGDEPVMVKTLTQVREAESKTAYIRKLIRDDWKRYQRTQKAQAQS